MSLQIHEVLGDGNCLLRAIAVQTPDYNHKQLRESLCEEYIRYKDKYRHFFENIDEYIENIRDNGEWCDETDIAALANVLGATIELYINTLKKPYMVYFPRIKTRREIIRVIYVRGCHYDAVINDWKYCDSIECTELAKITCPICTENFCRMCKINHDCRNVCKKPVKPTKRYVSDLSGLCGYCTHMSEVTCATCEHSMCVTCSLFHSCKQN